MLRPRLQNRLFALAAVTGALAGASGPARACPADCRAVRTFSDGRAIPGDRVYFKVLRDEPGPLSLKTAEGKDIPASIRMIGPDRVFAPIEPIAPNTSVALSFSPSLCGGPDPLRSTLRFETREASPAQFQDSRIEIGEYGLVRGIPQFDELNAGPIAFQKLQYRVPDTASALWHLTDISVSVDGRGFAPAYSVDISTSLELHAVCTAINPVPQPRGTCSGLLYGPGRHVVTIQPHVVGQPDPPAATVEIDFDVACNIGRAAVSTTDAGMPVTAPVSAGSSAAASLDAGTPSAATPDASTVGAGHAAVTSAPALAGTSANASTPNAPSGCSASGQNASHGAAWLMLFALVVWRRRYLNQA